eukprot:scaffold26650_cov63-Phaeocystis_antarctica.AAC.8
MKAHGARARELVRDRGVACHVLEGASRQRVGQRAHAWRRAVRAPTSSAHQRALDEVVDARLRAKAVGAGARGAESMVLARVGGAHPGDAPVEVVVRLAPWVLVVHERKVIPDHSTGPEEDVGVEHEHRVAACEQGLRVLEAVADRASARARPREAAVVPAYHGAGVALAHALASLVPRRLAWKVTRAHSADHAQVNVRSSRACGPARDDL